ncbi:MAG: sodium:solute symporter family transporter [Calditrichia bacterium]
MSVTLIIVVAYLLVTLFLGVAAWRVSSENPEDYFLADRGVGSFVLFFTLIATNFSAFFFLGFSGAGYRIGYSYYAMMGFGTALVSLSFYFIGHKVWLFGKQNGYITPPEMIGDRLNSRPLKVVYLTVMVLFTLPYLALQPIGAGHLLSQLTGGSLPYFGGAIVLSVFIVLYVFVGGMRSIAWTDVLQGILMFALMFLAVYLISQPFGGITEANVAAYHQKPELFSADGGGYFTPASFFSFMLLWALAVPMFPQMFMRFFMADNPRSLRISASLYPLVTTTLFICPIVIGVLGHLEFPDLAGREADTILPKMLAAFAPEWLAALVMVGALAAFMSTMDSQLLALSSMITRDIYVEFIDSEVSIEKQVKIGRILIVILAGFGLAIAYSPPATIAAIATQAFSGLAILFPTTFACIYWKRTTALSCIVSIIIAELLLLLIYFGSIPTNWLFGFLPVVPLTLIASLLIVIVSLLLPDNSKAN